ncbi:MAG: hypothetical protein ACLP1X_29985 [Polyangiaceae bacterium]|jgi:hypothetical protein
MPDPRVVYIVTAVVVLALVVWVVIVLARPDAEPQAASGADEAKPVIAPPSQVEKVLRSSNAEAKEALLRSRPRLDSHLEIQDQADGADGADRKS